MSPDHAITPNIIQLEMVRLTCTDDRPSRVIVTPGRDDKGIDLAVITFECDDIPVQIAVLPVHLLMDVELFCATALEPLADSWVTEKARRRQLAAQEGA